MSIYDSVLSNDRFAFAHSDVMGAEAVTYKPRSGSTRSIHAQVFRNLPPEMDGQGAIRYPILIAVANDSTNGISATELDSGADRIYLPWREGGTAKDYLLGSPEASDGGMLTFRVYGNSR